ncbi:MAG: metal-dependent hydrolase [Planctomycetales bacterium 71-10]|nr:MAG: metal-dependent hydrolase [Planctomycetales bacterium 71-10]
MSEKKGETWAPLEQVVTKELLKSEVSAWAKRIGVEPKEVHVRPMSRKWGSCSTTGRLTLDSGLTAESADFRREVIVHELVHLKVPNHGPLFRALLKAYLGKSEVGLGRRRVNATSS